MITFQGKGVYGAIVIGTARVLQHQKQWIPRFSVRDAAEELSRLESATRMAAAEINSIRAKALLETNEELAQIFEAHGMLLQDAEFAGAVRRLITENSMNAEYAVFTAAKGIASRFVSSGNALLEARAADVTDVSDRLIACLESLRSNGTLAGSTGPASLPSASSLQGKYVLCAEDLTPSETISLDKSSVQAFVTARGSLTSHVAILAKSLGIPAIVGIGEDFLKLVADGTKLIVDGFSGMVYADPDERTEKNLMRKLEEHMRETDLLRQMIGKESITLDGTRIAICANVSTAEEAMTANENDADGIGLLRSEYLYLEAADYPSEEKQFQAYRKALEIMGPKEVLIRTLDIGADKQAPYFQLDQEENPALGLRAIRICLTRPELFKTQLRALYRASVYGNLGITFPMIASVSEVKKILAICEEVKARLHEEGLPYNEKTKLGIMIETPAAAVTSDLLAPLVDYFSIGTNDLTQYALAIDRQNAKLEPFCDTHHEAVLRLIRMTADNAHAHGIPVGICGELAADVSLTETFLRMGIDELSVSSSQILPLRDAVRKLRLT